MADRKEPTPAPTPAEEAIARLRDALDLSPFLSPQETVDVVIRRIEWLADQIRDQEDA